MAEDLPERLYAGFPRRFRAAVVDSAILMAVVFLAVVLMDVVSNGVGGQGFFVIVLAVLLLYDPILVSQRGQTVGHRLMSLRVADDATDERLHFPRALIRSILKTILGVLSFILMALTRRHQAIHDRITKSVVVGTDVSTSQSTDFHRERSDAQVVVPVSGLRRILVTLLYSVGGYVILGVVGALFTSDDCVFLDQCTANDERVGTVIGFAFLAIVGTAIVLGWRGKLPGARPRPASGAQDGA